MEQHWIRGTVLCGSPQRVKEVAEQLEQTHKGNEGFKKDVNFNTPEYLQINYSWQEVMP